MAFREESAADIKYYRKQSAQLASKMRYLSAQFIPYLDGLWLRNAQHANRQARRLAAALARFPQLRLNQPVEPNQLLIAMPRTVIARFSERYFFYVWIEAADEVRFVTSWDTTDEDIDALVDALAEIMERRVWLWRVSDSSGKTPSAGRIHLSRKVPAGCLVRSGCMEFG